MSGVGESGRIAYPGHDLTPDEIVARLGISEPTGAGRRRAVAELAYGGRVPLAWLTTLRRAGWLPYDVDVDS